MKSRLLSSIARVALVSILPLLLLAVAVPVGLAGPEKPGATPASGKSERVSAYTLQGDTINAGNATTVFSTTHTDMTSIYGWDFVDEASAATVLHATGGSTAVLGESSATGVHGIASAGIGVMGEGTDSGIYGQGVTVGAVGRSAFGDGVRGVTLAGGQSGVVGANENTVEAGYGVRGYVQATSQDSAGGYFTATYGMGIYAESLNVGVQANSDAGVAVLATSDTGYGVYGSSNSSVAVYGNSLTEAGVAGSSSESAGVRGNSAHSNGVYGDAYAVNTAGVLGTSLNSRDAVFGVRGYVHSQHAASAGGYFTATAGSGVIGISTSRYGVYGSTNTGAGVYGNGGNGYGIYGASVSGIGLRGTSSSNIGIYASTTSGNTALRATNSNPNPAAYAGYFDGNVRINGNYVATGTKSAAVPTNMGDRLMYAEESTRNLFSDQGTATLKDGSVTITLDPLFAQTVSLGEGYQVFLTPNTDTTPGLGVIKKTATGFTVVELNKGKGSFSFDWRISALRKGYEKDRMAPAPSALPLPQAPLLPSDK